MMANISSGLYLLATLLLLSGVSLALTNNVAENIPHVANPKEISKEDRLELAIQTMMKVMEDGFSRACTAQEVREMKEEVTSVKEAMKSLEEGIKSLEEDVKLSKEETQSLKEKLSHAVDTITSSVTDIMNNATVCPAESDSTHSAIRPTNCHDLQKRGHSSSGEYYVTIFGKQIKVYCDMITVGGGWTVIQRRDDIQPHVDFDRGWEDYKRGFGDLNGEFWLGLDNIHGLTSDPFTPMRLRVELEDWEGEKRVALYHTFVVEDEEKKYRLLVGGYEKGPGGDPGDSLAYHNGSAFTTKDQDNDQVNNNCAEKYKGGWWYESCHYSKLNGLYIQGNHDQESRGVHWYHWKKTNQYSMKRASMKIRPR